jgi:hypothetical protein
MRSTLCLAMLLCSTVAVAAEPSAAHSGRGGVLRQVRPLHRHPTLIGMLRRNNEMRRRVGLGGHRLNPALTKAAQDHANYMAATGGFSHYTNGGPQYRATKYGFHGGVRENIAYGSHSVDSTFAMWQGSGAHYASIVSGTSDAGFGYAISPSGQSYWVGVYASPAAGDPAGESEAEIAAALEAEKKAAEEAKALAAAEAEKAKEAAAGGEPAEGQVVPASAEEPAEKPAAAAGK